MVFLHGKNAASAAVSTRVAGQEAEDRALVHLRAAGLSLVRRNYRTAGRGGGEIDLIMREGDGTLVFVEVRSRASGSHGGAGASIGMAKRRRIVFAARSFLAQWPGLPPCRFDAVLVEEGGLRWLRGAFDTEGLC